jgi:membrane-bound serine protease (ClpP class)
MRRKLSLLFIGLGFVGYLAISNFAPVAGSSHTAAVMTIDGAIDPISSDFLTRGIASASDSGYEFLVINLNTPGGTLEDTRDMVELLLASPIPVIVYVSPSGAQAASAGTFVTSAAHVAAMAPTTNIGAASPVRSGGEDLPETIKGKVMEDTAALLRGISGRRERNSEALERTVLEATSYTAAEALDMGIVDIVAEDLEDLLVQLDGRTVQLETGPATLKTDGVHVVTISKTLVERFLGMIANPDIAFLLLAVGGVGLLIEFLTPGLFGPGVIGLIALALAFVALGNMPVNWVGVGLILFAMVLFFLEAQAPGVGIFGIGGAISFILGAFLLFGNLSFSAPTPELPSAPSVQISLWVLGIVTIILLGSISLTARAMRQAKNMVVYAGATTSGELIGQMGQATTDISPNGTVFVAGEQWSAESDNGEPIQNGKEVLVTAVEGLVLRVFQDEDESLGEKI